MMDKRKVFNQKIDTLLVLLCQGQFKIPCDFFLVGDRRNGSKVVEMVDLKREFNKEFSDFLLSNGITFKESSDDKFLYFYKL